MIAKTEIHSERKQQPTTIEETLQKTDAFLESLAALDCNPIELLAIVAGICDKMEYITKRKLQIK